jgi:hypothetical protein
LSAGCSWPFEWGRATWRGGGVEDYDEEGGDGAEEEGNDEPEKAATMLRLGEACIDQAQGSPADVIARVGKRENDAGMVARSACAGRRAVFASSVLHRGRPGE